MKKSKTFRVLGFIACFIVYYSWLTSDASIWSLTIGELLVGLLCYGAYTVDNLVKKEE